MNRQRDNAILLNPWVAGQQLLLVTLAAGINFGSRVLDCAAQMRFALHLYNAMRTVAAIQPLPLLEVLLERLTPGPVL